MGGTRNLLMAEARGDHVAFLTQDAVPAAEDWLARLLAAFTLSRDVGLAFGPYRPRPEASVSVRRELTDWFGSFSDGGPRIDALEPADRGAPPRRASSADWDSSPTPTGAWHARRGSRCRFGASPTPRITCWPRTCCGRASPRSSFPRRP